MSKEMCREDLIDQIVTAHDIILDLEKEYAKVQKLEHATHIGRSIGFAVARVIFICFTQVLLMLFSVSSPAYSGDVFVWSIILSFAYMVIITINRKAKLKVLDTKMGLLWEEYADKVTLNIPKKYESSHALGKFHEYLINLREQTLSGCINLYEREEAEERRHHERMMGNAALAEQVRLSGKRISSEVRRLD